MQQLKYVVCMIKDNTIPLEAGIKCGHELDIDSTPIIDCANNIKGSQLLKMYGELTDALSPSVQFIPTIELNNSQNVVPQTFVLKDLFKSVCQIFKNKPKSCID
ncbi:hypothetical protein NQ317_019549 [Molorchus minor]|uniref:Uncharacterized protein n=1 Tax=Molorchus minor TaxID=1323400 RepID=A0ABQ9J6C8_9CUCU|nr:hypothetical protein NQ317_019549 [Molorchus minor]